MAAVGQGEQRRALIIGAGGLVLVAALLIGSRLFAGDDGAEEAPPVTTTTAAPGAAEPEPPPDDADLLIPELPDTIEIVELRDPFFPPPLVGALDRLGAPPTPGDGVAPPGDGDGDGVAPPGDGDGVAPPGDGDGDGDGAARPRARIDVAEVGEEGGAPFAVLVIDGEDGETARVREGDVVGPSGEFQVVDIDPEAGCVLVLFGDEPFTVCVGETPQK